MPRLTRSLLLAALAVALSTLPASADWLILRGGKRIETKGPWIERANKTVVFTEVDGHHSSVLISLVDAEATRQANLQTAKKGGGAKVGKNTAGEGKAAITDDNTKRVDDARAVAIARSKESEERYRLSRKQSQDNWDKATKGSKKWDECRSKYPNDYNAQRECAGN